MKVHVHVYTCIHAMIYAVHVFICMYMYMYSRLRGAQAFPTPELSFPFVDSYCTCT